jgi:hypothetical protein
LAKDDLRTVLEAVGDVFASLPDDRKQEIGAAFRSEYKEAKKNEN